MSYRAPDVDRRQILKAIGAGLATTSVLTACSDKADVSTLSEKPPVIGANGRTVLPWSNWSGNQACQPSERMVPRSTEELVSLVKESKQSIRCVGTGHSFSPLVPTDETLISLARFRGLKSVDANNKTATFGAGTMLGQTGKVLWDNGFALKNMPDIDTQSLAGAVATSTHGTGSLYGSLSSDVRAMKLVTGTGDVISCSAKENVEVFNAARAHLGSLGVVTEVSLTVRETFNLEETQMILPNDEAHPLSEKLRSQARRFEMYAFPYGDYSLMITIDETLKPINDKHDQADSGDSLLELKKWTERLPWLRPYIINAALKDASSNSMGERVNRSYKVFGNLRNVRFNEMEYSVPADNGLECLQEILAVIKKSKINVIFPIEYRFVKGDDIWLSQFNGRDSCSISCHNFADRDYKRYFALLEPVFLKYGGRPHWGKIHTLTAQVFAEKYQHWDDFKRIRSELDPRGVFLNKHTRELLS